MIIRIISLLQYQGSSILKSFQFAQNGYINRQTNKLKNHKSFENNYLNTEDMIMKLLVPIDGSRASINALKKAIEIAKKYDFSMTLMTVVEESHLTGCCQFNN